jgi:hypothetical protein
LQIQVLNASTSGEISLDNPHSTGYIIPYIPDAKLGAVRGLDKALFTKLATGDWIGRRHDLLITGKTGLVT